MKRVSDYLILAEVGEIMERVKGLLGDIRYHQLLHLFILRTKKISA